MAIYLILLSVASLMAVLSPRHDPGRTTALETLAFLAFGCFYVAVAALRYQVGGDWTAYIAMYDTARLGSLGEALTFTDPAFGLLMFVGGETGIGIGLVNGVCAALLVYGVMRTAVQVESPWLSITIAVPYLLIVVGMGYIRQAAAIGLILMAVDAVRRERMVRALAFLATGFLFHSTSVVTWPLFAFAIANRNRLRLTLISTVGAAGVLALLSNRLTEFSAGYIDSEYASGGAFIRIMMGLIPSLLVLLSFRKFEVGGRARSVFIGMALATVAASIALVLSPSSTAVDRLALYFSAIQVVAFGSIGVLLGLRSTGTRMLVHMTVITYAYATLLVWVFYATHSSAWIPYKTVFAAL